MSYLETGITSSVMVLGFILACAAKVRALYAALLVGLFALFHGMAHGIEMTGSAFDFAMGFAFMSALLHALGFALATCLRLHLFWLRAIGALMGMTGIYLFM